MSLGRSVAQDADRHQDAAPRPRSVLTLCLLAICAGLIFAGFVALGTWQVKRLQWKLDLIERVDTRVHAAAVPAPGPDRWPRINAEHDEYRHVRLSGKFLYPLTTRVQASTKLGSGYWLLTPLRRADGSIVLVNRGFVAEPAAGTLSFPQNKTLQAAAGADNLVTITGLLRMSKPDGAFLRHNDAAADRWYSRDVQAIAAARGLMRVAPYFVDADAGQNADDNSPQSASAAHPVGGLTVISFHNNHLVYAITWYALALMIAAACVWVARDECRLRRGNNAGAAGMGQGNEGARKS